MKSHDLQDFKHQAQQLASNCKNFEDIDAWGKSMANAIASAQNFLSGLDQAPAFHAEKSDLNKLNIEYDNNTSATDLYFEYCLSQGINPCSPRFLGFVPGGGLPMAAVGDFVAAITNRYGGVYQASPGAAHIENDLIKWLINQFGFGERSWGTLTSGGTTATVMAFCAARDQMPTKDWHRLVIYHSAESHNALTKALNTCGLGYIKKHKIKTNDNLQLDTADLQKSVELDVQEGLIPWLVYGTVGTVNTGAIDPIAEIAEICKRENIWFHIDGAYGGFFAIAAPEINKLSFLSKADSLVIDPHKGLFQPYGLGAVIVKDGNHLRKSFALTAPYLKEVEDSVNPSPAEYSFELTRHFRGLRLWFCLKTYGEIAFKSCLKEKIILARYLYAELCQHDDQFELGPTPELSIVTFRLKDDSDEGTRTQTILQQVLNDGKFHLSSTVIEGRYFLRACLLCFRTHFSHVESFANYLNQLTRS